MNQDMKSNPTRITEIASAFYESCVLFTASDLGIFGKLADLFSSFRALTDEERDFLKKEILWIYDRFLTKVAEGRKMKTEEVDRIGKGRVWTGSQARDIGLVDDIGGLSEAIRWTKQLAEIPEDEEVKLVIWPKKVSLLQALLGRGQARSQLDIPVRLQKIISTIQLLDKERPWALMPFWILPD